jgi:alanine dehydrogenase
LPFGLMLADRGLSAVAANPHLRAGLTVHAGKLMNRAVADSLGLEYHPGDGALAA